MQKTRIRQDELLQRYVHLLSYNSRRCTTKGAEGHSSVPLGKYLNLFCCTKYTMHILLLHLFNSNCQRTLSNGPTIKLLSIYAVHTQRQSMPPAMINDCDLFNDSAVLNNRHHQQENDAQADAHTKKKKKKGKTKKKPAEEYPP